MLGGEKREWLEALVRKATRSGATYVRDSRVEGRSDGVVALINNL
jgi:hypothetical protein